MYYDDSLKSSEVPSQSTAWLRPYRVRIFKVAGLTRDRFCLFWQASRRYSKSHWRTIPIHGTFVFERDDLGEVLGRIEWLASEDDPFCYPMDARVGGDDRPSALSSKCAADERSVIRCVAEVLRNGLRYFALRFRPCTAGWATVDYRDVGYGVSLRDRVQTQTGRAALFGAAPFRGSPDQVRG
jgi:hypothetical protein